MALNTSLIIFGFTLVLLAFLPAYVTPTQRIQAGNSAKQFVFLATLDDPSNSTTPTPSSSNSTSPSPSGSGNSDGLSGLEWGLIVVGIICVIILIALAAAGGYFFYKKKQRDNSYAEF